MKKITQAILLVLAVCLAACGKPSLENEFSKYNYYQKNLKQLAKKYPAFHSFMVILSNESYKLVKETETIKNRFKKAEKVAEANKVFSQSKLYAQLNSYDRRIESIKKKKRELGSINSRKHRTTIANATSKADQALVDAADIMKNARPADIETAVAEIKKSNQILMDAEYKLNSALRQTKSKTTSPFKKK